MGAPLVMHLFLFENSMQVQDMKPRALSAFLIRNLSVLAFYQVLLKRSTKVVFVKFN